MKKILVVAPHPDDETLGCGGTILRHKAEGDQVHWLIVTAMSAETGFSEERMRSRASEIEKITSFYRFDSVHKLGLSTTKLDTLGAATLIGRIDEAVKKIAPDVIYAPHRGDAHSDHHAVFDAVAACAKWFRNPSVKRVLSYETLSETDAALDPSTPAFRPNVFVDISAHLDAKIKAMMIYAGETQEFPFPRSDVAMRALATTRGAASGFKAAEAFLLLRERL